jgi:hypothetical protein
MITFHHPMLENLVPRQQAGGQPDKRGERCRGSQSRSTLTGVLAEDGDVIFHDLQESAGNGKALILSGGAYAYFALPKQNQHGCMSTQDPDFAVPGRRHDLFGWTFEHGSLGANDTDSQCIRHDHTDNPSALPASITSSMPPFM